jgi:hypothetical protein
LADEASRRGSVLSGAASPESPIAVLTRVVSAVSEMAPPDRLDDVVLADDAIPVADGIVEQVEFLRGDPRRVQFAPVGVERNLRTDNAKRRPGRNSALLTPIRRR